MDVRRKQRLCYQGVFLTQTCVMAVSAHVISIVRFLEQTGETMKKKRASLLFTLSLIFCASCNAQNNGSFATLKLEGSNASIQIKRVHIHAFLAEYDRYLILNVNGKPVVEVQISTDTGGYSRANVFSTNSSSTLIVQDRMGRYEINVERQKLKN